MSVSLEVEEICLRPTYTYSSITRLLIYKNEFFKHCAQRGKFQFSRIREILSPFFEEEEGLEDKLTSLQVS